MSEPTQISNAVQPASNRSEPLRGLPRKQAVNQTINIGRFPKRVIDDLELNIPRMRDSQQSYATTKLAERIHAGNTSLIVGPPGVGKTYIVSVFGFAWYERGYFRERGKAIYHTHTGLFREVKEGFKIDAGSPLDTAARCGLLVLDEITAQNNSVFDQRELRDLIDQRHRNKLPTVMVTNLKLEQLAEAFDEATLDRMFEGGRGIIEILGQSQRN